MRVDSLKEYVELCQRHNPDIEFDSAYALCKAHLAAVRGKPRGDTTVIDELFSRWYASLRSGTPDYMVYDSEFYIADLWACWELYSRVYLREITNPRSMHGISVVDDMDNVNVIVDLGNGIGLTTKKIAEIFPSASVYATNIEVSYQYKIASELATSCGFTMMSDLKDMPLQADMMFASEYFEHFDRPIEHLDYIMSLQKPRYMIIANGFNGDAIGHFDTYFHMDKSYSSKEMNKLFSACMIRHGYKRVKTRLWNDRPQYYKLAVPTVLNLCEQNPFTSSFNI